MSETTGTLESLALEFGTALQPLTELLDANIFFKLGVELPSSISGNAAISSALTAAKAKAGELDSPINALRDAIAAGDDIDILASGVLLTTKIVEVIDKLKVAGDTVRNAANSLPAAEKIKIQEFADTFAVRAYEYVVVGYLNTKMPSLTSMLVMLGLVDKEYESTDEVMGDGTPPLKIVRRFHFKSIPQLLSQPDVYFQKIFKWGENDFNGIPLLRKIQSLINLIGLPGIIYQEAGQPPVLEAYIFKIELDETVSPPGLRFEMSLPGNNTFDREITFSDLWQGTVHVEAAFAAGMEATLRPPFTVNLKPPTGNLDLNVMLGLKGERASGEPVILLGATGSSRLQAKSLGGSVGVDVSFGTSGGEIKPSVRLELEKGKLVIDFSEGDGFLQKLLSGVRLEANFEFLSTWDPERGLRFQGSGGAEVLIPLHLDLAIVKIQGIYLGIAFAPEAPIRIELAIQLSTELGPLVAVIDRMGAKFPITFPENAEGNLGPANMGFGFLPPKGIGLSIDTGVIKGGGFLYIDPDKGEYFGALELSFQNMISLKAIGIINTKMPDGSQGFALLILITAEFMPIQLGFGFTLNGVGGLLALNRSTDFEALRAGVRTGAVASILFPQDIIANITRIISDLKTIFPIVEGHFIIAPMGKIGWGTPTLITLEIGVILDIPRLAYVIIGVLRCILPTQEVPILKLQVNFAGGIDFDAGLIWFDASLFDSSLLVFTLSGDMALRIDLKEPLFVMSVGGFHPGFKEIPADLTGLKRIMLSLLSGDNPRLNAQIYFAVTPNTIQTGARVELYAAGGGFNIYGYLGYDTLIRPPFHFVTQISAGLALRRGTSVIAGVSARCELSGPTPWNANGEASLKLLFFKITVSFNVTWGLDILDPLFELVEVLGLIILALKDDRNWKADIPANTSLTVTLKKIELPEDKIIIHPFGVLSASQKVAPLNLEINKFGNQKPINDTRFQINYAGNSEEVREEFALANFVELSDSEKLARKSFERMPSGLTIKASDASEHGARIQKEINYELSYVHSKKASKFGLFKLFTNIFDVLVGGSAITKSDYSVSKRIANNAPAEVAVAESAYSIVNVSNMELHGAGLTAGTEAEAYTMYNDLVRNNPSLKGNIQVVSQFEL